MTEIDTKASREIRAAGTPGEWICREVAMDECVLETSEDIELYSGRCELYQPDLALIAHAANNLVPMCDEIDRLRLELEETKRQLKIADGLRQEWKEQFFEVAKAERKIKAALSSCWRVVKGQAKARGLSDAEKLQHIDRIARGAAPPSVLRGDQ